MSSIITSILSSTVGLLWNKALDTTAMKLKDGDVTDAKIRRLVVRELYDLKGKLDCLSRKDLLCSYSFLQQGVEYLNRAIDRRKDDAKTALNDASKALPSNILNEALDISRAMEKLKINSDKEFECARKRFEEARRKATEAFWNEALSIEDRIFAAKVRVVSEIFEWLDNPDTAITGCLLTLQELHSLPAIRDIFSVHLGRGIWSKIHKDERSENVKSVMLINHVLFQLNLKFGLNLPNRLKWPGVIQLDEHRDFNPIEEWQKVSTRKSWGNELVENPKRLDFDKQTHFLCSAVNSRGELVFVPDTVGTAKSSYLHAVTAIKGSAGGIPRSELTRVIQSNDIVVISKTKETIGFKLPKLDDEKVIQKEIAALAVDQFDNVYAARKIEQFTENRFVDSYILYVFDKDYKLTHHTRLDFLDGVNSHIDMEINKNCDIFLIKRDDPNVYVSDSAGKLKHIFQRRSLYLGGFSTTDKNEIIVASDDGKTVDVYTEEGELKSTIELPEDHQVECLAFHHSIGKILVLTKWENGSYFLLCYSETRELESSSLFKEEYDLRRVEMTSHPSGPLAVVEKKSIIFL